MTKAPLLLSALAFTGMSNLYLPPPSVNHGGSRAFGQSRACANLVRKNRASARRSHHAKGR